MSGSFAQTRATVRTLALRKFGRRLLLATSLIACPLAHTEAPRADWNKNELALLASLRLNQLPAPPPDPSNAIEKNPAAIELGKQFFFEPRFSRNERISCATCHDPDKQFQDGKARGVGLNVTSRRTQPLANVGHNAWFFWDGRKDSLWSQALAPIEDANEFGGNRARVVHVLHQHYRREYEALFGPLPMLSGVPADAGPLGDARDIAAWKALDAKTQHAISRAFANVGKAIAAFEKTLRHRETRFDRYVDAQMHGARATNANASLLPAEIRGLRTFIGKGRCVSCHNGPLFTDHFFHSTRVPPLDTAMPDAGREQGALTVQSDPFNCLGPFSDAKPADCRELKYIVVHDPSLRRAFKTPSLRGVATRAPYMHAGQFSSLDEVVRHYVKAPEAAPPVVSANGVRGHRIGSELIPLALDDQEIADLVAFLGTLSDRPAP